MPIQPRPTSLALRVAGFLIYTGCLLSLVFLGATLVRDEATARRGIVSGDPPPVPLISAPPFGVNVALEQYSDGSTRDRALDAVQTGGFVWVRQHFPWDEIEPAPGQFDWQRWDRLVAAVSQRGLRLIAVLDTSPAWARAAADGDNRFAPPSNPATFAAFVAAFAAHYKSQVGYLQLWDEPNIAPHWGNGEVNPRAYVVLLRAGYEAARRANPDVVVLGGGLAPTTETGPRNLNDVLYLHQMYQAGAQGTFDVLAVKPYGFWSGPDDRRVSPAVLNFSRVILLREEMLAAGDGARPAWAVEFGWNALPPGWAGRPSPWGTDAPGIQAERLTTAIQRARDEWPWLQVLVVQHLQPAAPPDDPVYGFALLDQNLAPRPAFSALRGLTTARPEATPGRYAADYPAINLTGNWNPDGQIEQGAVDSRATIRFHGTRLAVLTAPSSPTATVQIILDPRRGARVALQPGQATTLLSGLPFTTYTAEIVSQGKVAIAGWVVSRDTDLTWFYASLALVAAGVLVVGWRWARLGRQLPWLGWWHAYATAWNRLGDDWQLAVMVLVAAAFYAVPWTPVSLALLAVLVSLTILRLDLALALLVFSIPFFLRPKPLFGKVFSMVEILTMVSIAAWGLQQFTLNFRISIRDQIQNLKPKIQSLDWAVALLLALGLISPLVAELRGVALRELRVVVFEPVLLYALLRMVPLDRRGLWRLVDALVLAGVVLSLHALYQFAFTDETILAEGVRRVRSLYGSPNNLSLFLDRVLPLAVVVAAFGTDRRRRLAYVVASLPIGLALVLTFSRAAWLLGVPAAFLFAGLVRGRRALVAVVGALVAAGLALVPFARVERITSLLDLTSGTTFLRLKLWQATLNMIRDHPLFGVGLDNFLYQYRERYVLPEALIERDLSHPHNILLDFWVRLGVLGVVAVVWMVVAFFQAGWRAYRGLTDPDLRALALGLMASMVAALAHGLVDNSFFLVDLAFVFMFTLGLTMRLTALVGGAIIDPDLTHKGTDGDQ